MKLSQQKCQPCQVGAPAMSVIEVAEHIKELKAWDTDNSKISKKFKFADFKKAMEFINKVAEIAEQEDHHPDIHIFYNKVEIVLWTHAVGGLSLNDFILASKVDAL